jgi:hypothetical protein
VIKTGECYHAYVLAKKLSRPLLLVTSHFALLFFVVVVFSLGKIVRSMPTGGPAQDTDNNPLDQRGEKYKPVDCDFAVGGLFTDLITDYCRLTYYIPTVQPNHQSWSACRPNRPAVDRCSASSLGSPFAPVEMDGRTFIRRRCNNTCPSSWLGAGCHRLRRQGTDRCCTWQRKRSLPLFPEMFLPRNFPFSVSRECSHRIAVAVIKAGRRMDSLPGFTL